MIGNSTMSISQIKQISEFASSLVFFTHSVFICAIFVLIFFIPLAVLGQNSRVDAIKTFISLPPSIDQIEFKTRSLYQAEYAGAPKLDTNHYRCFFAKSQGADFVISENSQSLTNKSAIVYGKNDSIYWKIIDDNYFFWNDKSSAYSSNSYPIENVPRDLWVLRECSAMRIVLLQAVNMGISELMPGSVIWNGDSFTALDLHHLPLVGKLDVEAGCPETLHLEYANRPGEFLIVYDYSTNSSDTIPERINYAYVDKNGTQHDLIEYTIMSLQVSKSGIPPDDFSAKLFKLKGFTQSIQQDGNQLYWQDPQGATIEIKSKGAPRNTAKLFFSIIFFVSILFPLFFISHNLLRKNKPK